MRVRFILGSNTEVDYTKRFHMEKDGDTLVVRIDHGEADILGQLLARTTEKFDEKKQTNNINKNFKEEKIIESDTLLPKEKKTIPSNSENLKLSLTKKTNTASYNQKPKWTLAKNTKDRTSSLVKKTSFGLHQPEDKKKSEPVSLFSSGLKMVTTLSLVLGLIFLLFFGFKKYVLKNTAFGGGKLVQVLSTNFLAPKKNIALVEVAGEILVLGVSDQNISLLTSIREPGRIEEIKNAHGDNSSATDWKKGDPKTVPENTSLASSNAAHMFSKYLKQFSGTKSDKQDSVDAVTEKIRRHTRKLRTT
jgi:flagellar biosynthetic protein FliO